MKKYFLIIALFISLVSFTGCYTVVWSPDKDFPTADNSQEYYYDDYYGDSYYGGYSYFYGYPWWYSVTPPSKIIVDTEPERTAGSNAVRGGGGRGTPDRSPAVLPVERAGVTEEKDNSTPAKRTETRRDDSGSRSSSDDSRTNRNNDGGRSNDGKRR